MPDLGEYAIDDDVTFVLEVTNQAGVPLAITSPTVEVRAQDNSVILASTAMTTAGEGTGRARYVYTLPSSLGTRYGQTFRVFYGYTRAGSRQGQYDTFRLSRERIILNRQEAALAFVIK